MTERRYVISGKKESQHIHKLTIRHPLAKLIGCTFPILPTNDEHLNENDFSYY